MIEIPPELRFFLLGWAASEAWWLIGCWRRRRATARWFRAMQEEVRVVVPRLEILVDGDDAPTPVDRVIVPTVPRIEFDDVADRYAVEIRPDVPGGCIIYSEYHGKWTANPWSTRALVWTLLADPLGHVKRGGAP